jgi:hydroxymethylbilane synthase
VKGSRASLRIGTRGSALAVWQTESVRSRLASAGHQSERIEIKTTGDLAPETPLAGIGSRALFTKQIDDALLEHRIDLAVHSLKDLPTQLPAGILIGAVAKRDDPRDVFVGKQIPAISKLPAGALVGTSSLRRRAQLLHYRPELRVADLRGNVDTRLAKLDSRSEWAGIILAAAGLIRLGLEHRITERLAPELMLPPPGQGALAITVRAGDDTVAAAVRAALHDPVTALQVTAERAFLHALDGGCQVPIAALAEPVGDDRQLVRLRGRVVSPDGRNLVEGNQVGPALRTEEAELLGIALAHQLLKEGAAAIVSESRAVAGPAVSEP